MSPIQFLYQFNCYYNLKISIEKITDPKFRETNDFTFAEIFNTQFDLINGKNNKNNICELIRIRTIGMSLDEKNELENNIIIQDSISKEKILKFKANNFEFTFSENFIELLHYFSELSLSLLMISSSFNKNQMKKQSEISNVEEAFNPKKIDILQTNISIIINNFKFKIEDTHMNVILFFIFFYNYDFFYRFFS
jgi:hypothetical protein